MIQPWQIDEIEEQISQAALLLSKLLIYPDDVELRSRCENWITAHRSYINEADVIERPYVKIPIEDIPEDKGYNISELDGDETKLNF